MVKNYVVLLCISAITACGSSTRIVHSWRDPSFAVKTAHINKFVVAALLKNEAIRRRTEDLMVTYYPGKAVASYTEFGNAALNEDEGFYNAKLKKDGYDGIVVMRLVNVDKTQRYVPGNYPGYYNTWRGFYTNAWPGFYDPGHYTVDKTYYIEINVYSVPAQKLIWSGITSTINPSGGDQLFDDVIKAINERMYKEGFLRQS